MHSYTATNFDMREEYLRALKEHRKPATVYPNNVNFKDYFYYIRVPTLCYELEYPQSKEKFRLNYLIGKLFFTIMLVV